MSFLSFRFVIFIVVMVTAYYTVCKKNQWLLLLCGSLVFYCYASPYYLIFLLLSIGTAYYAAIHMGKLEETFLKIKNDSGKDRNEIKEFKKIYDRKKKITLVWCLIVNVGILVVLKYTGFFAESVFSLVGMIIGNTPKADINFLLPLGISFYTFTTVGYLLDVYWGVCRPQENFYKYALFISYFPHITQGPIDSYQELSATLYDNHKFSITNFNEGCYRIILGLFKKLVIAGRLAVYVDAVYADPYEYQGFTLLCATIFYAIQMYCDFSGYMDIAVGISRILGIEIAENFNLPYFSKSIPEYWRRWHITLGVWFRTYIFYPVIRSDMCKNLSKKLKKNHDKAFASMVTTIIGLASVWLLTGLWHGASWHYVMHGVYHGVIIIISTVLAGSYKKWKTALHISEESKIWHVFQIIRTFVLVDISYILFRSTSLKDAGYIMRQIFFKMTVTVDEITSAILPFTEDNTAVAYGGVVFVAVIMLFFAEWCNYNEKDFVKKHRYMVTVVMVLMTALFGIFGQSSFLYEAY